MNARHRKTLEAIFTVPTATNLAWSRIEALLKAIGCIVVEGRGSRVRFAYGQRVITVHRPHPAKEAKPYQVEDTRYFLQSIGITP